MRLRQSGEFSAGVPETDGNYAVKIPEKKGGNFKGHILYSAIGKSVGISV